MSGRSGGVYEFSHFFMQCNGTILCTAVTYCFGEGSCGRKNLASHFLPCRGNCISCMSACETTFEGPGALPKKRVGTGSIKRKIPKEDFQGFTNDSALPPPLKG